MTPITCQEIYTRVCQFILEPNGLTTGVLTEQQVLDFLSDAVAEFLAASGVASLPFAQLLQFGGSQYTTPDQLTSVHTVFVNEAVLAPETTEDLDFQLRTWRSMPNAVPRYWHEDRLPVNTVEVVPAPNFEGQYFQVAGGSGFYGTLSAASTFTALPSAPLYGTISYAKGPTAVVATAPLYGTMAAFYPSAGNLLIFGSTKSPKLTFALTDYIPFVPPIFRDYLLYGVLRHVYSDNAETKDQARAQYCDQRWQEGLNLARMIGDEALGLQYQTPSQ